MNQKQVKEKLKQAREAINMKQYCDAVAICQVITYSQIVSHYKFLSSLKHQYSPLWRCCLCWY